MSIRKHISGFVLLFPKGVTFTLLQFWSGWFFMFSTEMEELCQNNVIHAAAEAGLHLSITTQSSHDSPASSFHHHHQCLDSFHQHSWKLGLRWITSPSSVLTQSAQGWRLGTTADPWWPPISPSNKYWTHACAGTKEKGVSKKSVCVQLST